MAKTQESMPEQRSLAGQLHSDVKWLLGLPNRNGQQSSLGQLAALGREIMRDVRSTMMEVFFGKPETQAEPGTPMAPTQAIVTGKLLGKEPGKLTLEDLRGHAAQKAQEAEKAMEQPSKQRDRGMEM